LQQAEPVIGRNEAEPRYERKDPNYQLLENCLPLTGEGQGGRKQNQKALFSEIEHFRFRSQIYQMRSAIKDHI